MNSSKDYIRTVLETIQYSFGDLTGVVGVINRTKGPMDLKAE
ncbi:unnamed protein product, partial [marine sediment metagenome]